MRLLLLTALIFHCTYGNAANYYFSSSTGDDGRSAAQAQNPETPWRSLQKLNAIFSTLQPGDVIHFKRGDSFFGKLRVTKSGTAGNPIVFTAYGEGNSPVISGLQPLRNFSQFSGNIWSAAFGGNLPAIFLLNEQQKPLGRFPNSTEPNGGFLTFESHSGTSSITDNELRSSPNWTGGEIVIRKNRWVLDRSYINSHSGGTLQYHSTSQYEPADRFGYFIQNHLRTLDSDGEWSYDRGQKKIYLFQSNFSDANSEVQVSVEDTLFAINNQGFISINNLSFRGADETALSIIGSKSVSVRNCQFSYTGLNAILLHQVSDISIEQTQFNHSNNNAITTVYNNCRNITVRNCVFENTGGIPGLGKSGDLGYQAITIKGKNNLVENNRILRTGYVPIRFEGDDCVIQHNFIDEFCFLKDDGAGIYTWNNDYNAPDNYGRIVRNNIILNGVGAGAGTSYPNQANAHGIYLDDNAANVEITGNTVANCSEGGLYIHNARNAVVRNNLFYNNERQLYLQHDNVSPTNPIRNLNIKNNIFYSKTSDQHLVYFRSIKDDIAQFGVSDSNYFSRPFNSEPATYTSYRRNYNEFVQTYDLSSWQDAFLRDRNSKPAPVQLAKYKTTWVSNVNKVANSNFNNNVFNVYGFYAAGSFNVEWDRTGKLDGPSLQITLNTTTNNRGYAIIDIGAVTAGKPYLLKFSLLGGSNNKSLTLFLRRKESPYNRISEQNFCKVQTTRTENEFLFIPTETVSSASLVVDFSDQRTFWLDNVEMYEAGITRPKPDEHVRFEYNASHEPKTVPLAETYVDARNVSYTGEVTLAPFSSIVLFKSTARSKASQTIEFEAIKGKKFGDAAFELKATATSDLPVNFTVVSGPAEVSGNRLTLTGAGEVTISATQPGNEEFHAAPPVTQRVTVAKAAQSISFNELPSRTVGDAPFALTATATSGLPVRFAVTSGAATLNNNLLTVTGPGTISIEASQEGNANYLAATAVVQSFTVADKVVQKADQEISFASIPEKILGDAPFTLAAKASSGLPVSFAILSGPATVSGKTVTVTGVGTVVIEASQPGNDAFHPAASVTQQFAVSAPGPVKQSQTISFGTLSYKTYASPPFLLEAASSSGLPVSYRVVSGPASIDEETVTITGVGFVVIEALQPGNENYAAAPPVQRGFTVGKAAQILNFPNISNKTLGDAPFTLNASSTSGLPVSYRVISGPATVSGNIVNLTGIGLVTIIASQGGDEFFNPAFDLVRSFIVYKSRNTKDEQSITFDAPTDKTFGDESFTLSAIASSGLPVQFRVVAGPAVVEDGQVTITGAGIVYIEASQPGNSEYKEASPVIRQFRVNKAAQWLTFGTLAYKTYDAEPFALTATASSGLPVSYRVVSGPARLNGNIITITGVGFVTLEALQHGDDHYTAAAPVQRSFTVGKAPQVLSFPLIANKTANESSFALQATSSSGLPVSYSVVSGPATVAGHTVTLTGVGTVIIEANQEGNDNYAPAFPLQRTFTVSPPPGNTEPETSEEPLPATAPAPAKAAEATQPLAAINAVIVYPNPVNAQGVIRITVAKATRGVVGIYDKNGRLVKRWQRLQFEEGQPNNLRFSTAPMASGTYFVRLETSVATVTHTFQVMK